MRDVSTAAVAATLACILLAGGHVLAQRPVKTIDGGVLDRIELYVSGLDEVLDQAVVIRPFDASKANLGTGGDAGKDTRQQEAKTMQREGPRVLAETFVTELSKGPFKRVSLLEPDAPVPAGALLVEGYFIDIDPGSRAKRFLVGFGSGKSSVKVAGSVTRGGKTLATFEQRRIGAMGMGGGDSLGKLMADSRSIGTDIATFLGRWARGEDLED